MPRSSKRGSANISVFWSPMPIVTWWGAGVEGAAAAGAATTSASARTSTRAGIREPSLVTKAPRRRGGATCTAPKGRRRARRFASGDRPARALRVEPARRARQQRRQGAAHAAAIPWWPPAGRRVLVPGAGRGRVLRSGVDEADVDEAGGRHCGSSLWWWLWVHRPQSTGLVRVGGRLRPSTRRCSDGQDEGEMTSATARRPFLVRWVKVVVLLMCPNLLLAGVALLDTRSPSWRASHAPTASSPSDTPMPFSRRDSALKAKP